MNPLTHIITQQKKSFEEEFEREDGLINKYSFYPDGVGKSTPDAIKLHISSTLLLVLEGMLKEVGEDEYEQKFSVNGEDWEPLNVPKSAWQEYEDNLKMRTRNQEKSRLRAIIQEAINDLKQ